MEKIYSDVVMRHFRRRGVREECECCGKTNWVLMNNVAAITLQTSDHAGLSTFPVVLVECMNCGNMRFFRRSDFEESESE